MLKTKKLTKEWADHIAGDAGQAAHALIRDSNPLRGLATLVATEPDKINADMMLGLSLGYELCRQAVFEDIPSWIDPEKKEKSTQTTGTDW